MNNNARRSRSKIEAVEVAAHGDQFTPRELYGLSGPFRTRTRFLLLILVTLCMMINWANILTFNFTIICMGPRYAPYKSNSSEIRPSNFTSAHNGEEPHGELLEPGIELTNDQKYHAQAIVALAALVTNLPIVITINKYGPRYLFSFLGFFGAAATALIPTALDYGFWAFLICRALQGAAFAGDMAAMGSFMAHWTYYKQNAIFTATLCTYVQLAPIFTNPISGQLCISRWGWRSVYYTHAVVACLLFAIFFFCYRNRPMKHSRVGSIERAKISIGRSEQMALNSKTLPYSHIVRSLPFWAVLIGSIGNFCGVNIIYMGSPVFLNKVMGFKVAKTGFMAALPPLLMATFKETSGFLNDRLTFIPETARTKLFNSIAFFFMAAFLVVLGFIPTNQGMLALIIMTIGMSFLGFNIGGFYKSGTLIGRHYAPFVVGQTSTGMTITILLVPTIIHLLNENDTAAEWRNVFLCIAGIMVAANIFYLIFASGEPEYWARDDFDPVTGKTITKSVVAPRTLTGHVTRNHEGINGGQSHENGNQVYPA